MDGKVVVLVAVGVTCALSRADVVLQGDRLKLGFSSEDFHVRSFVGAGDLGEISAGRQTGNNALWRIELMSDRGVRKPLPDPPYRKGGQWLSTMRGLGRKVVHREPVALVGHKGIEGVGKAGGLVIANVAGRDSTWLGPEDTLQATVRRPGGLDPGTGDALRRLQRAVVEADVAVMLVPFGRVEC